MNSIMGDPHVVLIENKDRKKIMYFDSTKKSRDYFTIEALEENTKISLSNNDLYYCIDNDNNWIELKKGDDITITTNQKIKIKIKGPFIGNSSGIGTFSVSGSFNVEGNIMSLLYGDDFVEQKNINGKNYAFYRLFDGCKTLKSADGLVLTPTVLSNNCYGYMFSGCTSLTKIPILNATTLANNCYQYMFQGCTSLITAPELSATTLADFCYNGMFDSCTSLTGAPELPATTLASGCYAMMFVSCTSLTTAHKLPATTLASACYTMMFAYCTSLTEAPQLPATTLTDFCYNGMFGGCTSLTIAPELPATTLTENCYNAMFDGCSNLNYIMMLATDISASKCLTDWVNGVASSGTFVKNYYTNLDNGSSGIPNKWVLLNIKDNITCGIFYIDLFSGKEKFDFELGMTWERWVNSEYNTIYAYIENENIYVGGGLIIKEFDQGVVKPKDSIMTNGSYVQITQ